MTVMLVLVLCTLVEGALFTFAWMTLNQLG